MLGVDSDENFVKMMDIHAAGWDVWDLHKNSSLESLENCVYLTAEAEETLDVISPGVIYVIGGLVDRNRLPGVCSKRAKSLGLKGAGFPLCY